MQSVQVVRRSLPHSKSQEALYGMQTVFYAQHVGHVEFQLLVSHDGTAHDKSRHQYFLFGPNDGSAISNHDQ